jgi:ribosome biogenesis GTPase
MNDNNGYSLSQLGWDSFFEEQFRQVKLPGSVPARIASESRELYKVFSECGELAARISGKMRYLAGEEGQLPAVGDWVVIIPQVNEKSAVIHAMIPRKSKFSRKVAEEITKEQVVAANVDTVFIVNGLDGGRNLNLRRIERYLTLAWNSGATPVIVLNKTDLCPDIDISIDSVESVAMGVPVHALSARERSGLDELAQYLENGKTAAFLGSSGVGKSSIINALMGEAIQDTGEVRDDDKMGRHTTTRRELILLPSGGMVIDTPGMREIQMWAGEDDLEGAFPDIAALAERCYFNDCTHDREPGCAVRDAIEAGDLELARFEGFKKLQNELVYLAAREDNSVRRMEKEKWKNMFAKEAKRKDGW